MTQITAIVDIPRLGMTDDVIVLASGIDENEDLYLVESTLVPGDRYLVAMDCVEIN